MQNSKKSKRSKISFCFKKQSCTPLHDLNANQRLRLVLYMMMQISRTVHLILGIKVVIFNPVSPARVTLIPFVLTSQRTLEFFHKVCSFISCHTHETLNSLLIHFKSFYCNTYLGKHYCTSHLNHLQNSTI